MSLLKRLESEGRTPAGIISVDPMITALEEARLNVAKLEAAVVSLYSACSEATDMVNEFTDVADLTFASVEPLTERTAEDTIRFATGLILTLMDRFGLAATAVEENNKPSIDPASVVDLGSNIRTLKTITRKLLGRSEAKISTVEREPFVGVKGKAVQFELLSPIVSEADVPRYQANLVNYETKAIAADNATSGRGTPETERHSSRVMSEPRVEVARVTRSSSRSKGKQLSQDRSSSEKKRQAGPGRSRIPTVPPGHRRAISEFRKLGHHNQPVPLERPSNGWRASLPLLDDIDWPLLRSALNRTDQLYTRELDDLSLHRIMLEELEPRTIKGLKPPSRLAQRIRSML
jgi:hypothetical protein